MGAINDKFCDPTFFEPSNQKEARKLEAEQKRLRQELADCEQRWEAIDAELEELG